MITKKVYVLQFDRGFGQDDQARVKDSFAKVLVDTACNGSTFSVVSLPPGVTVVELELVCCTPGGKIDKQVSG